MTRLILGVREIGRDAQLAARALARTPGFAVAAIGSLALAIGVTAGTAALVNAYLVRSLPFADAHRLYHVQYAPPGPWEPSGVSGLDWASLSDVVEHAIAATSETLYVTESRSSAPSRTLLVSAGFLEGLGVRADLGRVLDRQDYREADAAPAVISARLWRERFDGDPAALGREFRAEVESRGRAEARFRVVGVLPDGFWFGRDSRDLVDVLLPLRTPARAYRVRLRDGVPPAVAAQRITEAVRRVATDVPPAWPGVTLESARDRYVAAVRPILGGVTIAAVLLLAIACANLAVLTLLRAIRRQKEISVRIALGAGRVRTVRLLLVEAGLLVSVATAAGLVMARFALALVGPTIAEQLGRPAPGGEGALQVDASVVLAVSALGVLVAAALPLFALLTPWGNRLAAALRRDRRTSTDTPGARRWRAALVAAQVAGSLTLLVGSGLMIQSLANMVRADYGIRTEGLVRVGVDFSGRTARDPNALVVLYDQVVERVSAITRAPVPLFQWPQFAETPRQPVETDIAGGRAIEIGVVPVTAAYFDVLGIDVEQGRGVTDADRIGSDPIAVVSRTAARTLFAEGSAIGRRIRVADGFISGSTVKNWRTVVGVVADVRQTYDDRDSADIYIPFLQAPAGQYAWFYVMTDQPARVWEPSVRDAMTAIDPRASIRVAVPLSEEAARQWAAPRFLTGLVSGFAAFAMLLAVLGIYGVTAFSVQQREREVAIRSALGATERAVVGMFLREGGVVVAAGLGVGLAGAAAVGRALGGQLHGVTSLDATTFLAAPILLGAVALLAIWRPAARAARRSPATALGDI